MLPIELLFQIALSAQDGSAGRVYTWLTSTCKKLHTLANSEHGTRLRDEVYKQITTTYDGIVLHTLFGLRHRDNDLPAMIWPSGSNYWYRFGQLHREGDQPAEICASTGLMRWWYRGMAHREGGQPALIFAKTGTQEWYVHGEMTGSTRRYK